MAKKERENSNKAKASIRGSEKGEDQKVQGDKAKKSKEGAVIKEVKSKTVETSKGDKAKKSKGAVTKNVRSTVIETESRQQNEKEKIDKKTAKLLGLDKKSQTKKKKKTKKADSKLTKLKLKRSNFITKFTSKFFDSNEKQVQKLDQIVQKVREEEERIKDLTQKEIVEEVKSLKEEFQQKLEPEIKIFKEKKKAWLESKQGQPILDFILSKLPQCFALVSEATYRVTNKRLFNVQLMAGTAISQGRVIEFKTGEGKTYVAPLGLFVYSLFGRGAYLVTVNDYLAKAHGEYIGNIMDYLGITVGVVIPDKSYKFYNSDYIEKYKSKEDADKAREADKTEANLMSGLNLLEVNKKEAYLCDITYGTHAELGFDYLRDNMQNTYEDMNQRDPFFCIIDEVDSILIDEARTPLIISSSAEESNVLYKKFADLVKKLDKEDYLVEEKEQTVSLTETGIAKMEKWLNVQNLWEDPSYAKYLDRSLLAHYYYTKDDQYVVNNGEVVIVDEYTGRLQHGRRYSNGIHQAIEAKEGVEVKKESRTLASVTYQNYFRLFAVLSGMTGTALTEAEEFGKIYNLDVLEIPTNKPVVRVDKSDSVYKDENAKFNAIVKDIAKRHKKGQPILVGTISVEKSEKLAKMLTQKGIKHETLNAKNHSREAKIIAKAGEKGSVTISTNMAGRGTDIRLGKDVAKLGGLYVVGTERHESRRIDNQLRGRSGRQGDPGASKFYLALDDEVMRMYGGDKLKFLLNVSNLPDDVAFDSKFMSRSIKSAQRRVEAENFDSRKHLVDFDDVSNRQRLVIYNRRKRIIELYNEAMSYYDENKAKVDKKVQNHGLGSLEIRLRTYVVAKLKNYMDFVVTENFKGEYLKNENLEKIYEELFKVAIRSHVEDVIEKKFKTSLEGYTNFLLDNPTKDRMLEQFRILIDEVYDYKEKIEGFKSMRQIEKYVMLKTIDTLWVDHLETLEDIRYSSEVMSYGQRDPLSVYQNEGYVQFCQLMEDIDLQISRSILLHTTNVEKLAEKEESKAKAKQKVREAQESLEKLFKAAKQSKLKINSNSKSGKVST